MPTPGSPRPKSAAPATSCEARSALRKQLERIDLLLLIRLRSLGDSILTLPLLHALHEWRPDLKLDLLVESPFAPVFAHHPAVHEVLGLRRGNSAGWTKMRALYELRRRHYPGVLNLHGGTTSLLFSLGCGAPLRIGCEYYRESWAYNFRIPHSSEVWQRDRLHTVEHQLTLMRWLELPLPEAYPASIYVDEQVRARVGERLRCAGASTAGYFLIHPTATLVTKQWPAGKFARLADCLSEQYGCSIVLTSGPAEAQILLDIGKNAVRRHHYWSDLSLEELFALIEGARLFIGNDSGPTHAAAALARPVVVVWGSSNFHAWRPWGTDFEAIRSDLPCMPCAGYTCEAFGKPRCILDITVESVLGSCASILERNEAAGTAGRRPNPG